MSKNKHKRQSFLIFLISVLLFGFVYSFFPQTKATAQTANDKKAVAFCRGRISTAPTQTPTGLQYPDPAVINSRVAWCAKGFLTGLKENAKPPGPANTPLLQICYTSPNLYKGDQGAAFYCQMGYSYAYSNRETINNSPDPSQPTLRERARSQCVTNGNIPGGSNKEVLTQACQSGFIAAKNGKSRADACRSYSGINKQYCQVGYDLAKPSGGDDTPADDEQATDCDTELTSPLSWILCPLIDMGSATSDFVFNDVAKPLLSDVPISANRQDGSYQAWQGFRFLANIMLIGSMLAIVYAQVRGEK